MTLNYKSDYTPHEAILAQAAARRLKFEEYLRLNPERFVTLGRRLAELRCAAQMTQEELANVLEVNRRTVCNWEADACCPGWYHLLVLSVVWERSVAEMLSGVAPHVNQRGQSKKARLIGALQEGRRPSMAMPPELRALIEEAQPHGEPAEIAEQEERF